MGPKTKGSHRRNDPWLDWGLEPCRPNPIVLQTTLEQAWGPPQPMAATRNDPYVGETGNLQTRSRASPIGRLGTRLVGQDVWPMGLRSYTTSQIAPPFNVAAHLHQCGVVTLFPTTPERQVMTHRVWVGTSHAWCTGNATSGGHPHSKSSGRPSSTSCYLQVVTRLGAPATQAWAKT